MLRPVLAVMFLALAGGVPSPVAAATRVVAVAEGALEFDAPAEWPSVTPGSRIVEHELSAPAPEGSDAAAARLTVMAAGGSVDANVARWIGQFAGTEGGADRSSAKTEEFEAGGMRVTLVDLAGTYLESAGGPFGPKTPRPGYRMLGGIIETGTAGNYFFKLVGPEETVAAAAEPFRALLGGVRKKP